MTTVIAVQCRDGVILCADSQESAGYTKEEVIKIHQVGLDDRLDKYCVLGCAGYSDYIPRFREYVGKAFLNRQSMTYLETLDGAICDYTNYIVTRSKRMGDLSFENNPEYPQAIFAGYDPTIDKTQVYVLNPPTPPRQLAFPYRKVIGTGELFGSPLFGVAEKFMYMVGLNWSNLSTKLVAQFCHFVLGRVFAKDLHSGLSSSFYKIDKEGCKSLDDKEMFPGHGDTEKYRLSVFLRTLLEEVPPDKLWALLTTYNVHKILLENKDLLRKLMDLLSADYPSEK